MRKFTTLFTVFVLLVLFGLSNNAKAQNMATNGDIELWTGGIPDNWNHVENITQESTIIHGGSFSAKHESASSTKDFGHEYITGIVEGNDYNYSLYYLDNDPDARMRVWSKWKDAGGATVGEPVETAYSEDSPDWQQFSTTITAPAGATQFYIEVRVYKSAAGTDGGYVYYDDFVFENAGAATPAISKAYSISDTELDVLYNIDVTSVNAADYTLTGTATITFSTATIDGSNAKLVHLSGASQSMAGDITLDNIDDAANTTDYDFYAGIMPVSFVNTTNPGGTMNNTNFATFQGIVSANDGYNNVWFSDADGAYNGTLIFDYDFDGLVDVGDEILVYAKRDVYSNLTELKTPMLISTVSTGNSPYGPDVIDGSDIDETVAADTDPGEKWEGQFVTIEDFTVDSYSDYDYRCSWSDGSNTYYFHIGDNVDYQFGNITLDVGTTYGEISGVVDWSSGGPYFRINPRDQDDVGTGETAARIVGSMQGWNTTDPDYVMSMNANGVYELTKTLDAGDHEYKVIEGDDWTMPNYPTDNQHVILTAQEDVTWKTNIDDDLVTHLNPVMTGNFFSLIGGNDWDPAELMGEMTDPDGDDVFTLELLIPQGDYECKVALNHNWDQSTGGNVPFSADGVNATTFTYDFSTNTTTVSGPPPPTATVTFIVDDSDGQNYDGFYLKGSWDANGNYDPSWNNGDEHTEFFDDGTNGDATADDHIWTCQQNLVSDGGANTWEWGVNDSEHNWVAGNWQFTVPNEDPQTLTWDVPTEPFLVINEIMYNSPGADEEWVELYNTTGDEIDLEGWKLLDSDATHTPIEITAGYSIPAGGYFTIEVATDGNFPFVPDFDGSGNFGLNNGGDVVRLYNADGILVDFVEYDDGGDWPSAPDGDGPSLSLVDPDTDNNLGENWDASDEDGGTPGEINFIPVPYITVVDPNGGEFIQRDTYFDINWEYGNWDGDIKIELFRDGQTPSLIISGIPAVSGTYNWYVLDDQELGDDYKILITALIDDAPFDESDEFFSIIEHYDIPNLVLTEIMYNPPESGTDSLEFLEIYNNGEDTVNMKDFYFTEGIEYTFPEIEILPDSFLLVAKDSLAMLNTFAVNAYQWTSGGLKNSGEDVEIRDLYDNVIDYVDYDDSPPWDTLADGFGNSLTLCNPDADNNVAENWTHSVNFAAINADGDSIWATPGFECQVELLAAFTADTTLVIVGDSVLFTDMTVGEPTSWEWTFEGGTPDAYTGENPPYIVYADAGRWDVKLVVSDGINTDSITHSEYIWSGIKPVADFEATQTTVLVGDFTTFINNSIGDTLIYDWYFEDGDPETSTDEDPGEIYYLIMDWAHLDVQLIVSNEFGSDTLLRVDYIETIPESVGDNVLTDDSFVIYPNPTNSNLAISIPENRRIEIEVFSMEGRLILSRVLNSPDRINVESFENGLYLIRATDVENKTSVYKKLIKN